MTAARQFIMDHKLSELVDGKREDIGLIVQGGLYNAMNRALQELGLDPADSVPTLVLNVVYPLVPEEILDFAADKSAEEGRPVKIEELR